MNRIKTIKSLLILLAVVCFSFTRLSGKEQFWYSFKQISIEQGLSYTNVQCILKDSDGFLWIGTKNGLNRFDRYELKNYYHTDVAGSLPSNQILFLAEDASHTLWIGTTQGLVRYCRKTDSFIPVLYKGTPLIVSAFCLHEKKGIIFAGEGELLLYDYVNRYFRPFSVWPAGTPVRADKIIRFSDTLLLLASRYGPLCVYNLADGQLRTLPGFNVPDITAICVDKEQQIWLSSYHKGLYCYDISGKELHHFTQANSGLSNDLITDIIEKDNQLWIATDGGGITIFTPGVRTFEVIRNVPEDIYSLPEKSIRCLYNDSQNNLWAGTVRGGLLSIQKVPVKTFKNVPLNNPYGLSDKVIVSLYEEPDGILWIGTDGGGINSFDPKTQQFSHYLTTYPEKVVSIAPFTDDKLLISCYSKGVFSFDKHTQALRPFLIVNKDVNEKECTGISLHIAQGLNGDIYFCGNRLWRYNKNTGKFFEVEGVDQEKQRCLLKIGCKDSLMYLMNFHHIVRLDLSNRQLESVCEWPGLEIRTAAFDGKNRIWIGTCEGLFYYDMERKTITAVKTGIFQSVTSLNYDREGRLWIGADKTLFCYYVNENKYIILGESDNVPVNELFHLPLLTPYKDYIYIGGNNGLICIDHAIAFDLDEQPLIGLSDIQVNGTSRFQDMDEQHTLLIPWNTQSLELKLRVQEKDLFRKRFFRYRIAGLEERNIETYDPILHIGTLPPGKYSIVVSCDTHEGNWSAPVCLLSVRVLPPFWKTGWFTGTGIILFVLVAGGIVSWIIKKKQDKFRQQLQAHEKKVNEDKVRFLINISHELRTPLTLVYSPMKQLLECPEEAEERIYVLKGMFKQVCRMKNIVNMVLDLRFIEAGGNPLHVLPHVFNAWVSSVTEDFRQEFEFRGIRLEYQFDQSVGEVAFDEAKCTIVLSNLLMNAVKYTDRDTTVRVVTKKMRSGKRIRVSVSDEGPGLSEADIPNLFFRFYQGKYGTDGYGIGLSYAKTLIEMHGGEISAYNNDTVGATFYFELPDTEDGSGFGEVNVVLPFQEEALEKKAEEVDQFDIRSLSLLVVEDEPDLNRFLKKTLGKYVKHVYTAANGIDALHLVGQYKPDLIVSDIRMPRMNGFEFCKTVKSTVEISHIPIVLLTARNDEESNKTGYKMGADAYVTKPFDVSVLIEIIKSLLKNRLQIKRKYQETSGVPVPPEVTFSNADEQFLLKLNKLILDHLDNPALNVTFLIGQMGMGRSSFYAKIKALTDLSANEYINKIRIDKAVRLLETTHLSIAEISEQVGFEYPRYFSAVFKQIKGITPTHFRNSFAGRENDLPPC